MEDGVGNGRSNGNNGGFAAAHRREIRTIEEMNREYAERGLELYGGNRSKAAEVLGISRTSLWRLLQEE